MVRNAETLSRQGHLKITRQFIAGNAIVISRHRFRMPARSGRSLPGSIFKLVKRGHYNYESDALIEIIDSYDIETAIKK